MNDRCTEGAALSPARAGFWRGMVSLLGFGGAESRAGGVLASDERNGQPAGINLSGELPERGVRT